LALGGSPKLNDSTSPLSTTHAFTCTVMRFQEGFCVLSEAEEGFGSGVCLLAMCVQVCCIRGRACLSGYLYKCLAMCLATCLAGCTTMCLSMCLAADRCRSVASVTLAISQVADDGDLH
jgi:hypothetical protein